MKLKMKKAGKIFFGGTAILGALFLSGCFYSNQQQNSVLRGTESYDIKKYDERQTADPDLGEKLTVNPPSPAPSSDTPPASAQSQQQEMPPQPEKTEEKTKEAPAMQIDETKTYSAVLKTGEGEITIDLDAKKTPKTVNNFISLARDGFYGGTTFHRVIKNFMIQGGDPNGDGSGGPGYKFDDENLEGEYKRGTVAMANSGPNTNGSQFFIIHKDYDLPKQYVVFGHVSKGMDVVDKIAEAEVTVNKSMEKSKPVNPVKIDSVEIKEK
ncbi:MAG: peptidylprolyl isomerase [Parcubacteria group bacterium]|jgi:peptidylprolyl isomerase